MIPILHKRLLRYIGPSEGIAHQHCPVCGDGHLVEAWHIDSEQRATEPGADIRCPCCGTSQDLFRVLDRTVWT